MQPCHCQSKSSLCRWFCITDVSESLLVQSWDTLVLEDSAQGLAMPLQPTLMGTQSACQVYRLSLFLGGLPHLFFLHFSKTICFAVLVFAMESETMSCHSRSPYSYHSQVVARSPPVLGLCYGSGHTTQLSSLLGRVVCCWRSLCRQHQLLPSSPEGYHQ